MAFFLGVDAGGTRTQFLLGDESQELGRVHSGSIKRLRRDSAATQRTLSDALRELTARTGVSMLSVSRCCVGASGVTAPVVADWITQAFRPLVGGEFVLVEDVEIALDAAFPGSRGVLVLSGTGSNVAGRGLDGKIVTAGGWGPAISDEGSGHFLGIEALRRAFRALDERRPTLLIEAFQSHWKVATIGGLIEVVNANPAPDFSQLAPLVVAYANGGDQVAIEVVRAGGIQLASLTEVVLGHIREAEAAAGEEFDPPPVAMAGSILEKVPLARRALEESLRGKYPAIRFLEEAADPVQGALWRARQRS